MSENKIEEQGTTGVNVQKVVTFAFRKLGHNQKKVGSPVLEFEVIGNECTFENVGKLLFKHYL
jgi:hypothetical protein